LDKELSDEDHALSDEDHALSDNSDCISDCSEDHTEVIEKYIFPSEVNALNGHTKQCAIYFYYLVSSDYAVCTICMVKLLNSIRLDLVYAMRKHVIELHDVINGKYCSECRAPLFQIFPCNMCPICTQ